MTQKKLVTGLGEEYVKLAPRIVDVKPCHSQILIELLNPQEEKAHSPLYQGDKRAPGDCPQAYILKLGPAIKPDDWGFKVGDRVMVQGVCNMVPNYHGGNRERHVIEPHHIKAVLVEEQ